MSDQPAAPLSPDADRAARLGVALAMTLTLPAAIGAIGLALRVPLTPLPLVAAAAVLGVWFWRDDRATAVRTLTGALVVIVASSGVAAVLFDLSYDGQNYHQTGIRLLADGWNPVWDPARSESVVSGQHVSGLPKGMWVLAAMVAQATGSIEAGKAMHLVAMTAAWLLAWPALVVLGVDARRARLMALVAALSPVAVQQVATYHVDGLVSSAFVAALALAVLWIRTGNRAWGVALAFEAAWLATLKFNAAALALELAVAIAAWVAWRERARLASALRFAALATVLALAQGINPYITNIVRYGHPAYPLRGRGAILTAEMVQSDPKFLTSPRVVQLAKSVFGASSGDPEATPQLKLPFAVGVPEIAAFTNVDARIGGWGPWFGGALLLGWIALAIAWRLGDRTAPALAALSVAMLATAIVLPFGFYARYAPQTWLAVLPSLALVGIPRGLQRALAAAALGNIAIVGAVAAAAGALDQALHRRQLSTLVHDAAGGAVSVAQDGHPFVNVDLHLSAYGIAHVNVDAPTCPRPALLLRTHALLCLPGAKSPPPTPDPLDFVKPWLPASITLPVPR
ncbi:MAG: hypothetical protein AABZ80_03935 [Gemmatimonadota bacterium]